MTIVPMDTKTVLLLARARRLATSGEGRRIRLAADLSLANVADALGVMRSTVWRWEHGERTPRGDAAIAWAELMGELDQQGAVA